MCDSEVTDMGSGFSCFDWTTDVALCERGPNDAGLCSKTVS